MLTKTERDIMRRPVLSSYACGDLLRCLDDLDSKDAEIAALQEKLKTPHPARDFVNECNTLLAAKDAEIERLRASLRLHTDGGECFDALMEISRLRLLLSGFMAATAEIINVGFVSSPELKAIREMREKAKCATN